MMARIRSIHPSLWTDEDFVSLSMATRLLIIGIWNECDDEGIFVWKPLTLKMRILPADNVDIGAMLEELSGQGFVRRYELDGKSYGAVRNFCKFQRPQKPKPVHPKPQDILEYLGLKEEPSCTDTVPLPDDYRSDTVNPNQMEDGGWRMEEERGEDKNISSLRSDRPAKPRDGAKPKRKSQIPADCPAAEDREKAEAHWRAKGRDDLDLDEQAEKFRAHHLARGSVMADWSAAWRTWYANAVSFERPRQREGPDAITAALDPNRESFWDKFKTGTPQ